MLTLAIALLFAAAATTAEAKDGRQALEMLRDRCRNSVQGSGSNMKTAGQAFLTIRSVKANLEPLRKLTAGETVEVTVEGDFPEGTMFMFGGWDGLSETADFDGFDIVKQQIEGSTLHATIRLPKTGLLDDRGRPASSRTYINLDATAIGKSCASTHKLLVLTNATSAGPSSGRTTSQAATGSGSAKVHTHARTPQPPPQAAETSAATVTPAPVTPVASEKPRTIRIGVAIPEAQIRQGNASGSVAEPIQTMIAQYLSGPALEIVPITAMLPIQIEAEAKEKACDYVVYSSVTQKKNGGMGILKAADTLSSLTPIGMMAGTARAATAAAGAAAAAQAASVSTVIKAKTEYTLQYRLIATGNPTPVLSNSTAAKAKTDGEDVITPLVQQAATAIFSEVTKKK